MQAAPAALAAAAATSRSYLFGGQRAHGPALRAGGLGACQDTCTLCHCSVYVGHGHPLHLAMPEAAAVPISSCLRTHLLQMRPFSAQTRQLANPPLRSKAGCQLHRPVSTQRQLAMWVCAPAVVALALPTVLVNYSLFHNIRAMYHESQVFGSERASIEVRGGESQATGWRQPRRGAATVRLGDARKALTLRLSSGISGICQSFESHSVLGRPRPTNVAHERNRLGLLSAARRGTSLL